MHCMSFVTLLFIIRKSYIIQYFALASRHCTVKTISACIIRQLKLSALIDLFWLSQEKSVTYTLQTAKIRPILLASYLSQYHVLFVRVHSPLWRHFMREYFCNGQKKTLILLSFKWELELNSKSKRKIVRVVVGKFWTYFQIR